MSGADEWTDLTPVQELLNCLMKVLVIPENCYRATITLEPNKPPHVVCECYAAPLMVDAQGSLMRFTSSYEVVAKAGWAP